MTPALDLAALARETAEKLYPMYCQHFNGHFCDACAPAAILTALQHVQRETREADAEIVETIMRPEWEDDYGSGQRRWLAAAIRAQGEA